MYTGVYLNFIEMNELQIKSENLRLILSYECVIYNVTCFEKFVSQLIEKCNINTYFKFQYAINFPNVEFIS